VLRRSLGFDYERTISEAQLDTIADRINSMTVVHTSELSAIAAEVAANPQLSAGAEPTLNAVLAESRGELPPPPPKPGKRRTSE